MKNVAIIGRPNVGKSSLFNAICKKNIAIVNDEEGTTRDRIYFRCHHNDKIFNLIDTAGIDLLEKFSSEKETFFLQTSIAIADADIIILVVDGQVGPTFLDEEIVKLIIKEKKFCILAVNKVDLDSKEHLKYPFHGFHGVNKILDIAAVHKRNIDTLIKEITNNIQSKEPFVTLDIFAKIAIIGKPNSGKSTILNAFLNSKRTITSELAGTTRDCIDEVVTINDKIYQFIDTAGIKRKNKEKDLIEKISAIKTKQAIKKASICFLLIDIQQGITEQDKKIFSFILSEDKPCIILINKWDLIKNVKMETIIKEIKQKYPYFCNYPIIIISAKTKKNLDKVILSINDILLTNTSKISTHKLNSFINNIIQKHPHPMIKGKRLKIYYILQKKMIPPHFILFINHRSLMTNSYKKYLINQFYKFFNFFGLPVILEVRSKKRFTSS